MRIITAVSVGVALFCVWMLLATAGNLDAPMPRFLSAPDPRIAELEAEVAALKARVIGLIHLAHERGFGGEVPCPDDCIKDPWIPHVVSYTAAELDH